MTKTVKIKVKLSNKLYHAMREWRKYAILWAALNHDDHIRADTDIVDGQNSIGTITTENSHNVMPRANIPLIEPKYDFAGDLPALVLQLVDTDNWHNAHKETEVPFHEIEE